MAQHLVDVVVEHDYKATEEHELTIKRGDIIRGVEQKAGGWWRGELRGRVGIFPDNFVRLIGAGHETNDVILRNTPRYCRAMFSYQQANPDELNLSVGDMIQVLGEVEEGWWRGQIGNQHGVFPSNFVVPIENVAPPTLPPKPVREQCRVLFPYVAANSDELSLTEGDIVTIVSRDVPDQGWWRGELRGRIGLFPDNFVTVLPMPESITSSDASNKKPSRPSKNMSSISQMKTQPMSSNRKDISIKSSMNQENVASVRKSLEVNDTNIIIDPNASKSKKPAEPEENSNKIRKSVENDTSNEVKTRRSLEVDGANKPPVPVKKAGSPVAAMLSGLRQKLGVDHNRFSSGSHQQTDTPDGGVSSKANSGEPILTSVSPSPSPIPSSVSPAPAANEPNMSDNFDQIERNSMLNDPRATRVKAPRRRLPGQATKDEAPLTNGGPNHSSSTDTNLESEIKPKTREWEKHKAPWMEELKLNQAKKTSPIAEIGRSKTISTTETSDKNETPPTRLSGSSEKILDPSETENNKDSSLNPLEMSQSMTSLSSKTIKIEKSEEVKGQSENPIDMSKSMSSLSSRVSHLETNNKVSSTELRTSISSSANVILRSTTHTPSSLHQNSNNNATQSPILRNSVVTDPLKDNILGYTKVYSLPEEEKNISIHNPSNGVTDNGLTPEQLLISKLNERVANLEKVVETQEAKFTDLITVLKNKLDREIELRCELQAEIQKLERCVTRV